jgi:hypothetical protein
MATAYGIRTYGAPVTGPRRDPIAVGTVVRTKYSAAPTGTVVSFDANGRALVQWADQPAPIAYATKALRTA